MYYREHILAVESRLYIVPKISNSAHDRYTILSVWWVVVVISYPLFRFKSIRIFFADGLVCLEVEYTIILFIETLIL